MLDLSVANETEKRRDLEVRMRRVFRSYGYREIDAPVLMDYDTLRTAGSTAEDVAYKLVDEGGRILVLRPDMTAPIADMAARRWTEVPRPIRVSYFARLFRRELGEREFFQAGAEIIGSEDDRADAEAVGLCAQLLEDAGVGRYQINLGHTGVIGEIADSVGLDQSQKALLRDALSRRDIVAVEGILGGLSSARSRRAELLLPYSGVLDREGLDGLAEAGVGEALIGEISHLLMLLGDYAPAAAVGFDPSLVRNLDYYTGPVFEVYCPDTGDYLGGGGRYDGLMGSFGVPEAATGFAVDMGAVASAASSNGGLADADQTILVLANDGDGGSGMSLVRDLRGEGHRVVLESIAGAGDARIRARANELGAQRVFVVGDEIREFHLDAESGESS